MRKKDLHCTLCNNEKTTYFGQGENRQYYHCPICDLVFVPAKYFVSYTEEKAKYDHHQNCIDNTGYVNFLNRLLIPLQKHLPPNANGLDFGCGPGPTLHLLMEKAGYSMKLYDYFYASDQTVFTQKYDFITSTEVLEHLHHPLEELKKLWACLKKNGVLGLMTAFRIEDFSNWYYKRDLTHIAFYTPKTLQWIANYFDAELIIPQNGVAILQKV